MTDVKGVIYTQFISSLSDTGKKLLVVALIILVVALFDRLLIGPTVARMAAIDQDIVAEESSIKQDIELLSRKEKILKESKALEPYITKQIPTEEEIIAAFLKKLEVLAGKANVTIIKVTPQVGVQDKNYIKYQADLECAGVLADVISFMHLLNSSTDLTKVIKFNISAKKADTDEVKAVMSVIKAIVSKDALPAKPNVDAAAPSKATSAAK
jgi:hypothetical protein